MVWKIDGKILVPFDFGDSSHRAVDKALELVASPSQINIVHAIPTFIPLAPEGMPIEWSDDHERLEQAKRLLLEEFKGDRYTGVQMSVLVGDPGIVCTEHATEIGAELIVLPSHGRTGLARLILGSVAEEILRHSKCPVLVLKI